MVDDKQASGCTLSSGSWKKQRCLGGQGQSHRSGEAWTEAARFLGRKINRILSGVFGHGRKRRRCRISLAEGQ